MQGQRRKRWESGFTFIEVMVSMVIASFVFSGIYGVYTIQQRSYAVQEQVSEMQQKGRAALDFMVRDVRMAGYNDPDGNCTSQSINSWVALPTKFAFDKCEDGNTTPVTVEYGLYDVYDGTEMSNDIEDDLYRIENGGTPQLIVEGLDAVEFSYILEDEVNSVTTVATADVARIRSIQISLLVRSTYPDQKYTETVQYTPASGATDWEILSKTGPLSLSWYNYHRRLLITTVKLRNMGL
ncbi:Type IV pilus assembly protein PilW [Candidatus Electrothrix laxa]